MKRLLLMIIMTGTTCFVIAQQPDIFQAIHCEPQDPELFPKLIELVELADSLNIPLTIMFTPQWASQIIITPSYLVKVRQWQSYGHEIACHHHGVEAPSANWDGYTNQPEETWPKPVEFYLGNMTAYYDLLSRVAGDSLMITSCMPAAEYDWPAGLIYRTDGHALEHVITQPEFQCFFGQDVYCVGHGFIRTENDVQEMSQHYTEGPDQVMYSEPSPMLITSIRVKFI